MSHSSISSSQNLPLNGKQIDLTLKNEELPLSSTFATTQASKKRETECPTCFSLSGAALTSKLRGKKQVEKEVPALQSNCCIGEI